MRTKHARQTREILAEEFGEKLFDSVIRQSIAYAESAERAVPILEYRPDRGRDYLGLAREIMNRLEMPERAAEVDRIEAEMAPRPQPAAAT